MTGRFALVLEAIDAANAADPERALDGAAEQPAALLYGRRMSAELVRFSPDASEHLRIAVRGQHIERWKTPRASYPQGREGYLRWRTDLARFHAERVAGIMREAGYGEDDCARVMRIIRKQGLKRDPEVQTLEDVAALVFMRWHFADFAAGRDPGQVHDIVAKTARKMSAKGREAARALGLPAGLAPALEV
ncbi:MAG TPA: DUF4202 domain-containing protein [Thermohalobaculum sp.]|nr:DUF4202 domain-containing protein [Thermohalobaculum sp.]